MDESRDSTELGTELADRYFEESQRLAAEKGVDGTAVLSVVLRRLRDLASEVGVPPD